MATLDERFIISGPLNQYFVDKTTALPLSGGKLFFFKDSDRTSPKSVYELTGTPPNYSFNPLPNPVILSSVGTIMNASNSQVVMYFNPYDADGNVELYYIVCEDAFGNEQWTREGWPNLNANTDPTNSPFSVINQISNPQFSRVFIEDGQQMSLDVTAGSNVEFPFAPDWFFRISGTGSVTINRLAISGNDNVATSPPYILNITVPTGITNCQLVQRMKVNSGLWASTDSRNVFLSGKVLARNNDAGDVGITMYYVESSGGSPIQIVDDTANNTTYKLLTGTTASLIPASSNVETGEDGYIEIYIQLGSDISLQLSSLQVVPTFGDTPDDVDYDASSSNRAQALMGDYFIPNLEEKRIPSYLVGWDFPLNPAQQESTTPPSSGTINVSPGYAWDQTIVGRAIGDVVFSRSALTSGMEFTTSVAASAFYILQYLDGEEIKDMLGQRLSSNVSAFVGAGVSDVNVRVYLFRGTAASAFPVLPLAIGTVASTGVFTITEAGWSEIPRSNLDTAIATLKPVANNEDLSEDIDYQFNGWEITGNTEIGDTDKFAIVVTFECPDITTTVTVNSVSLTPGDIATRPAIETETEVQAKCSRYYQKSYNTDVSAPTATSAGEISVNVSLGYNYVTGNTFAYASAFTIEFSVPMRTATQVITIYDPDGTTPGTYKYVEADSSPNLSTSAQALATFFVAQSTGNKRVSFRPLTPLVLMDTSSGTVKSAYLLMQYTADARIGVI